MKTSKIKQSRLKTVDFEHLGFGDVFADHMFLAEFKDGRWQEGQIIPYDKIEIYPALCVLHYGQAIFEGIKAFKTKDGVQIFRPDKYYKRLCRSAHRLCIPEISWEQFIEGLAGLVRLDKDWVPGKKGCALYIRPFAFGADNFLGLDVSETYKFFIITSPVGAYYKEGFNPVSLMTSRDYIRAARGGLGTAKTPANYAASLFPSKLAKEKGYSQILWLDAHEKHYIEEVGTMNIFFVIDGEVLTPSLEGTILDGVMRDTSIALAKSWGLKVTERKLSINEVIEAAQTGKLQEAFGTGTAAVISPVGKIHHQNVDYVLNNGQAGELSKRLFQAITDLQYGIAEDKNSWCYKI